MRTRHKIFRRGENYNFPFNFHEFVFVFLVYDSFHIESGIYLSCVENWVGERKVSVATDYLEIAVTKEVLQET